MPGTVFISAKSEDYSYARQVHEFLAARGVDCFFADASLLDRGQSAYRRVIEETLDASMHLVVVTTSREYALSRWVEYEWGFFQNEILSGRKKGNLLTVVCGGLSPAALPAGLRGYQVVRFEDELDRLPHYLPGALTQPTPANPPTPAFQPPMAAPPRQPAPAQQYQPPPAPAPAPAWTPPPAPAPSPAPPPIPQQSPPQQGMPVILIVAFVILALAIVFVLAKNLMSKGGKEKDRQAQVTPPPQIDNSPTPPPPPGPTPPGKGTPPPSKQSGSQTLLVPVDYKTVGEALAAAKSGDTVRIRAGSYDGDGFHVKEGVDVVGDSRESVIIRCGSKFSSLIADGVKKAKISGITFEHNDKVEESTKANIAWIGDSSIEVVDCRFRLSQGFGMHITKGAMPLIHDCIFEKNGLSGITIQGAGTRPTLRDNRCDDNGEVGIRFSDKAAGVAERNRCTNNGITGLVVTGGANVQLVSNIASKNKSTGIFYSDGATGILRSNQCEDNVKNGIMVTEARTRADSSDNTCRRNGLQGISYESGATGDVLNNTCSNNRNTGIWFSSGATGALRGNQCDDNTKSGIAVIDVKTRVESNGNTCLRNGLHGISYESSATGDLLNNTCDDNGSCGLAIFGGKGMEVTGNKCRTNKLHGINIADGSNATVEENEFRNNSSWGAAIFETETAPVLRRNQFIGNTHGGIWLAYRCKATESMNTYSGNNGPNTYRQTAADAKKN